MKIISRNLTKDDYSDLKTTMIEAYRGIGGQYWREEKIDILLDKFPEGQLCVEVDGKVVACALSIVINYNKFGDEHTYQEVTGNYTFSTHNPKGDVLYGIEVFVHPEYRDMRLGRRLYDARKELCERLNLRSIVAGGRIPNYNQFSNDISPKEYIEKVKRREVYDSTLSFQLANDFHVRKVLKNYLPGDTESKDYATLLEWNNIYFQPDKKKTNASDSIIRIGVVQWQMRLFNDVQDFYDQVEFFVDAVSSYKADFILFPEFFNMPLLAEFNHLPEPQAIRELAGYTEQVRTKMQEFAISYNVNIVGGSMPLVEEERLYNAAYLYRRDGTSEEYRKIHITPNEVRHYGMVGGDEVAVFDTDCGKIGLVICYDVEFPELSRLLGKQGMEILFVPFLTDTQNGYMRVRNCAQARAIENECYVAISGCVGNLPKVENTDIHFAQSAVFTPSDFAFPTNAIKAEATPNTEMMLIADVDLVQLKELHEHGSVQIMKDRRTDLYDVTMKKKSRRVPKVSINHVDEVL
ncbi:bifunctional GNAT family N-acetyltransferase/carbon-nitrogen hydrolase family protein [Rhabdobacter roseus]|uniref:Putative amidohydrolase/GNAT superfamily N-acetyltransferase n=1 Tax=Rhabdobacter roseus TaxID=1655419 RepID=A0A840TNH9_9BACT|nr:bifunctional GNAT family N-acetyltransferase/carbon-nitrogen hydrolase family protein [Rhabdobacter roseus]MBB5285826.1 putative amidohydrolase/GNAT superfamily N-acetyltransferase [Rhabdobacter roseus]